MTFSLNLSEVMNPMRRVIKIAFICTSNDNMELMGKPDVIFEELPVLNQNQRNVCDGKLKDMATGNEMNSCDKYCKKFRA